MVYVTESPSGSRGVIVARMEARVVPDPAPTVATFIVGWGASLTFPIAMGITWVYDRPDPP